MLFFILEPAGRLIFGRQFAFADQEDPSLSGDCEEYGVCPACKEGLGMLPWLPPQRASLSKSVYGDFLWGAGFRLAVSDRFLVGYNAEGLTGITRVDPPIEIVRVGRKRVEDLLSPPPPYHNIRYVHDGADLDDRPSGAKRSRRLCKRCRLGIEAVKRVRLREGSWTGADIFQALGLPGHILVTERLKAMAEKYQLKNAEFIPAEEYHFDSRV